MIVYHERQAVLPACMEAGSDESMPIKVDLGETDFFFIVWLLISTASRRLLLKNLLQR